MVDRGNGLVGLFRQPLVDYRAGVGCAVWDRKTGLTLPVDLVVEEIFEKPDEVMILRPQHGPRTGRVHTHDAKRRIVTIDYVQSNVRQQGRKDLILAATDLGGHLDKMAVEKCSVLWREQLDIHKACNALPSVTCQVPQIALPVVNRIVPYGQD
jgi:hypothetical protein